MAKNFFFGPTTKKIFFDPKWPKFFKKAENPNIEGIGSKSPWGRDLDFRKNFGFLGPEKSPQNPTPGSVFDEESNAAVFRSIWATQSDLWPISFFWVLKKTCKSHFSEKMGAVGGEPPHLKISSKSDESNAGVKKIIGPRRSDLWAFSFLAKIGPKWSKIWGVLVEQLHSKDPTRVN